MPLGIDEVGTRIYKNNRRSNADHLTDEILEIMLRYSGPHLGAFGCLVPLRWNKHINLLTLELNQYSVQTNISVAIT